MLAAARAVGGDTLERFTHGTTVATNALLERKGARTAFVATAGFEHLLHLRRQDRAHLYRLCDDHPPPLVPLQDCFGVAERMGPDGVLRALDLDSLPPIDAEAVAVCLLFSFRDPSHEQAVTDELRRRLPGARVVASHEIAPEFREYERASTTAIDAYLGPVLSRYLEALAGRCAEAGLPEPLVMRSSGGVATVAEAAAHPAFALLSGPAAGVVGAAIAARSAGVENAISFDMGGTSTDVALISRGVAERSAQRDVAGYPVRLPTVDLHTVGAGGGSIAWVDEGGALRVGPGERRRGTWAGVLRKGRGAADGHGREPRPREAARAAGRRPAARSRCRRAGARRDRPGRGRRSRQRRDAARAARRLGRARARPARAGARGLRRCADRCTRASSPRSSRSGPCSCPQPPACSPRSAWPRATSDATTCARISPRSQRRASSRRRARPISATRASRSS